MYNITSGDCGSNVNQLLLYTYGLVGSLCQTCLLLYFCSYVENFLAKILLAAQTIFTDFSHMLSFANVTLSW